MTVLYTNNAFGTFASPIGSGDLTLSLSSGQGALFPTLTAVDWTYITLIDTSGNKEIVKVTARSGDVFTIIRAQDGTSPRAFASGDKVSLRVTRAMLDDVAIEEGAETNLASATSPDIGAVASHSIRITGTTGITGFAAASSGVRRRLRFASALTLTHSASLLLPGAANITTALNDTCEVLSLGSGNWIVTDYQVVAYAPSKGLWLGANKTVSASAPSGGVDGDIWIQY